jgi:hypothetical protein
MELMFRAECWIERIQTSYEFVKEFPTLEEAQAYCAEDFKTRGYNQEFLRNGGYDIYEQTWRRLPRPEMNTNPTLDFN